MQHAHTKQIWSSMRLLVVAVLVGLLPACYSVPHDEARIQAAFYQDSTRYQVAIVGGEAESVAARLYHQMVQDARSHGAMAARARVRAVDGRLALSEGGNVVSCRKLAIDAQTRYRCELDLVSETVSGEGGSRSFAGKLSALLGAGAGKGAPRHLEDPSGARIDCSERKGVAATEAVCKFDVL